MKKIIALVLALAMTLSMAACGAPVAEEPKPAETDGAVAQTPEAPVYEDMGTIMWLSNISSGIAYDVTMAYMTALCDALGYEFTAVYGDPFNDAAGNLNAVMNGMTDDVVGLITSQDGGLAAIMEEYPDLWVVGYNTDLRSVYTEGGENAACLQNDKFLGTICDGYADGAKLGQQNAEIAIANGYKKVSIVNFPAFAYPNQTEADIAFRAAIEEYNKTAEEPIEIVGETTTLMFETLPDSWFLEEGRSDLDCIIALCAGMMFVYPTMVSAVANGTCSPDTKMITGGFETDPDILANVGQGKTIEHIHISPLENIAYSLILIDNAVTGNMNSDFTAQCVDSQPFNIDTEEDLNNVMTKSMGGTADVSLAQLSVEEVVALCGRNNPDMTQAELIELFHSEKLSTAALKNR